MIQEIQEIVLDSCYYRENFKTVKQNDSSTRFLRFRLSAAGTPLDLTGTQVRLYCRKPDNTSVFTDMEVTDAAGGVAQAVLTTQMLAVAGELCAEVRIYADAGKLLSTLPFSLTVAETICDDTALESTNEFSALTCALTKINDFSEIADYAKTAANHALDAAQRAEQAADNPIADGAVTPLKLAEAKINVLDPASVTNEFLNADGTVTANPDYLCTAFIPCNAGEKYACPGGNRRRGAFYDSEKNLLKFELYGSWNASGVITIPENAEYFRLCYGAAAYDGVEGWNINNSMICFGDTYFSKYIPFGTNVPWLNTTIPDKSVAAQKVQDVRINVLNLKECADGILVGNGSVGDNSNYFVSGWIPVSAGEVYTLPNSAERFVCYYDISKNFIQYLNAHAQEITTITVPGTPGTARYMRVSFDKASFDVWNPMVCKDAYYYSEYSPYGTEIPWLERNPLKGKKLAVLGDSICALHKSYINIVAYQNNMDFDRTEHNQSVWGSPLAAHHHADKPKSFLERFGQLRDSTDYLVIHGGVNDCGMNIPLGAVTAENNFSGAYDGYTFCGGLEILLRNSQSRYPYARIIFVTNYKLLNMPKLGEYMDAAKQVCSKFSVPVLDLYNNSGFNMGIDAIRKRYFSDDTHLNEWGHLRLADITEKFLMRL